VAERVIDLNADLGEGGPADAELLDLVTSASIACGFHAGSPVTMLATARAARARGVAIGAHPSYDDREGFGRRPVEVDVDELFAAVLYQVGAMTAAADAAGWPLRFVKPHGALYNRASTEPAVAEPVVRAVAGIGLPLLCPGLSRMEAAAKEHGVVTYSEAFADRTYATDGSLLPRTEPGAVIHDAREVAARAVDLALGGVMTGVDGSKIAVAAHSICVHGDTPEALDIVRAVRSSLAAAGVKVRPFVPA
jgi:5-oxoprolinase (ATP-hydrolysing) subunit A